MSRFLAPIHHWLYNKVLWHEVLQQDILKLANFDVLIATHSPDIINERWDLTVELKGPNK